MVIRRYKESDCLCLAKLFSDTVYAVNSKDYTEEQIKAWVLGCKDLDQWNKSLLKNYTLVCVLDGVVAGFGDIENSGYLNRLFVHKDFQRRGAATALLKELESAVDVSKITVHSSITARPFFAARGYKTVSENQVTRNGVILTNFIMEKIL